MKTKYTVKTNLKMYFTLVCKLIKGYSKENVGCCK